MRLRARASVSTRSVERRASLVHRLDAVARQVEQHLLDHRAVAQHARQPASARRPRCARRSCAPAAAPAAAPRRSARRRRPPRARCSRRRTKSCTLLITRPARSACSAMRCDGLAQHRGACRRRGCPSQQVQRAGGVAGDRRQRLVQLVAQQRGHLAHGGQPRRGLQPLLLLARQLLDAALLADVEHRAHPAGLARRCRRPAAPRRSAPGSARRSCA